MRPTASSPRPAARPLAGFTLLEVVMAFAILSMVMSALAGVQAYSVDLGGKALDTRDVREMSDTVFRRFIYELQNYNDGQTETGDRAYAEFANVPRNDRHKWSLYRLVYHKRKGMAAGTDPSGRNDDLFGTANKNDTGRTPAPSSTGSSGSTGSSSSGSGSGTGTGTGGTGSTTDDNAGVEAYLLSLDVFYAGQESEEPLLTLRTVVPIPASEETENAK